MRDIKGSKTEKNLWAAFAGESQARNKYGFYAKTAAKEGYRYIARMFEETAVHERRHARDLFKKLGVLGDTISNLKDAIKGEDYETSEMYVQFADDAEAEGFREIADLFRQIGKVEAEHRDRYKKLLGLVETAGVFKRETPIRWKCVLCGAITEGKEPPKKCPCCSHPLEYFEPENMSFQD